MSYLEDFYGSTWGDLKDAKRALIGHEFKVGKEGFVTLVDVMGSDQQIVEAARVSYGAGTRPMSDDITLIRYLMRHRHETPFEMAELKFMVKAPMDTWRQWVRHRTASINEYSTRYSEAIDAADWYDLDEWRTQSKTNKQGGGDKLNEIDAAYCRTLMMDTEDDCRSAYLEMLKKGVSREQARRILPLATYTKAYWKVDLRNLLHFLELRLDKHAQAEIREYANVIASIVKTLFPWTYDAFIDYRLMAVTLSPIEQYDIVCQIQAGTKPGNMLRQYNKKQREIDEFLEKFEAFKTSFMERLGVEERDKEKEEK